MSIRPETKHFIVNLSIGCAVFLCLGLLLWGVWHLVRLPALTIDQVIVTGGETISHERMVAEVEEQLIGEYWGFIPRSFTYTYPKQEILNVLLDTPRVKDPIIERRGRGLLVTLAEYEPVALWCDTIATTTPCVFLDEAGYGFAAAPQLAGGSYTRYVYIGKQATTGAVFADLQDVKWLQSIDDLLSEQGFIATHIELDQASDAFIKLSGGGELKVTTRQSPEETVDNLLTVLRTPEYEHITSDSFVYIDLRFGNKVFVSEFGPPEEVTDEEFLDTASSSTATTTQDSSPVDAEVD